MTPGGRAKGGAGGGSAGGSVGGSAGGSAGGLDVGAERDVDAGVECGAGSAVEAAVECGTEACEDANSDEVRDMKDQCKIRMCERMLELLCKQQNGGIGPRDTELCDAVEKAVNTMSWMCDNEAASTKEFLHRENLCTTLEDGANSTESEPRLEWTDVQNIGEEDDFVNIGD